MILSKALIGQMPSTYDNQSHVPSVASSRLLIEDEKSIVDMLAATPLNVNQKDLAVWIIDEIIPLLSLQAIVILEDWAHARAIELQSKHSDEYPTSVIALEFASCIDLGCRKVLDLQGILMAAPVRYTCMKHKSLSLLPKADERGSNIAHFQDMERHDAKTSCQTLGHKSSNIEIVGAGY